MHKTIRNLIMVLLLTPGLLLATEPTSVPALGLLAQPDHFALVRHALAPGGGDPVEFDVTDCATQRNLDVIGRQQAQAMGELLRSSGVNTALMYSSQWCRCRDTARLMQFGEVIELPALNSFFQRRHLAQAQTEALQEWLATQPLETPTILVTHQVNITALVGVFPSSGEIIIVKRHPQTNELRVIDSVDTSR